MNQFLDKIVDIDGNISKHPITDDLDIVINEKAIYQHMELLLMQSEDALLYRPGVCAGLRDILFEEVGFQEKTLIKNKVKNSLSYEPRIDVTDVTVSYFPEDNEIIIEIHFILRQTDKKLIYKTTLKRVL